MSYVTIAQWDHIEMVVQSWAFPYLFRPFWPLAKKSLHESELDSLICYLPASCLPTRIDETSTWQQLGGRLPLCTNSKVSSWRSL